MLFEWGALAERLWLDIQLYFLRLLNLSGFAPYKANAASRSCTIEQPGSHFRFEPLCEIRTANTPRPARTPALLLPDMKSVQFSTWLSFRSSQRWEVIQSRTILCLNKPWQSMLKWSKSII